MSKKLNVEMTLEEFLEIRELILGISSGEDPYEENPSRTFPGENVRLQELAWSVAHLWEGLR